MKRGSNIKGIDESAVVSAFKSKPPGAASLSETPAVNPPKDDPPQNKGEPTGKSDYYKSRYLKGGELKTRHPVYITKETHAIISQIVKVIGDKDVSVGGYIENVLTEHLENYKNEINDLYRQDRQNLI